MWPICSVLSTLKKKNSPMEGLNEKFENAINESDLYIGEWACRNDSEMASANEKETKSLAIELTKIAIWDKIDLLEQIEPYLSPRIYNEQKENLNLQLKELDEIEKL